MTDNDNKLKPDGSTGRDVLEGIDLEALQESINTVLNNGVTLPDLPFREIRRGRDYTMYDGFILPNLVMDTEPILPHGSWVLKQPKNSPQKFEEADNNTDSEDSE